VPVPFLLEPPKKCFFPATLRDISLSPKYSFLSRLVYHRENLAPLSHGKKIAYLFRKLPNAFSFVISLFTQKAKKKIKMLVCRIYCHLGQPLPLSLRQFYLLAIYRQAIQRYTPKLYQGRIILCHSDRVSYGEDVGDMIAGEVEVHQVVGADHQNILNEPSVKIWAKHLNRHLRELHEKKEDNKE
jgi:hypothetical protein